MMKKYTGEIILLLGLGIASYNIFNFTNSSMGFDYDLTMGENIYYYENMTSILITLGIVLTGLGVLIIKNRNN